MKDKPKKGNPFKRGSTWTFIYYVYDENGKRHQKWKGGYLTKEDAKTELARYQFETHTGRRNANNKDRDTLSEYLKIWFNIHKRELKPNSINAYYRDINKYIVPNIGYLHLKKITPLTLKSFYYKLLDNGLAPKTIARVHSVINTALKFAVDEGYLYDNPCRKAKPPSIPKYKATVLSKEQMLTLIKHLNNKKRDRYDNAIKLSMLLGLRRGEVLGLRISDIDFNQHTITISKQVSVIYDASKQQADQRRSTRAIGKYDKSHISKHYGLTTLKSESSLRTLFVSSEVESILREQIEIAQQIKAAHQNDIGYNDLGLLFCNDLGNVSYPESMTRRFKRILKSCDLPDIRFHDLRHSYATLCIDLNIPLKTISQSLGHSSISTTDLIYADSISAKRQISNIISAEILV